MNRLLLFTVTMLTAAAMAVAAVPKRVEQAAKGLREAPAMEVDFKINALDCKMTLGAGGRFILDMGDAKVYYDGKTQWAYSVADKEVTEYEPTPEELAEGNPAAILSTLATAFDGTGVKANVYRLTPLSSGTGIAEVTVKFPPAGQWPKEMTIVGTNGTLEVTEMKFTPRSKPLPDSAFRFKTPKGVTKTRL